MTTIAIIGAGNMGASIAFGLLRAGHPPEKITIADPSDEKLAPFVSANVLTSHNNQEIIQTADVIILAIKPQILPEVVKPLSRVLEQTKPIIISIAAGVSTKILRSLTNKAGTLVRAMPNLPAIVGCGVTALFTSQDLSQAIRSSIENIFNAIGSSIWLTHENAMDAVTAVSGSGPAYFFFLLEVMEKAAKQMGLSVEHSKQLILQTAAGAIEMAMIDSKNFAELRQAVTSKGGTTESALQVLARENVESIFIKAIEAAKARSEALSQQLELDLGV